MKNHYKYCLFFLLFISATTIQAQEFFVGLKGGAQYYTIRFAEEETRTKLDNKGQIGFKAGATIIFPLPDDFYFGAETFYSRKGRKYLYDGKTLNKARYNFIEISSYLRKSFPITFGENTYPGKWFVNVGPNIMYWMNGTGRLEDVASLDYDVVFSEPQDADFNKNYIQDASRWLFGLDFGVGINFITQRNQNVFIEIRYTHGHTYFGGEGDSFINVIGFQDDLRAQYRILHLSIAYLFDINLRSLRKGKSTIKRR